MLLDNQEMLEDANGFNGDLDCDGDVERSDLAVLLAVYGTTCK